MVKKLIFVVALLLIIFLAINGYVAGNYLEFKEEEEVQYILIPGAEVKDGKVSPLLEERLEGAIQLYRENHGILVVSGTRQEMEAMKNYLLKRGLERKKILLDKESFRTIDSIKHAKSFDGYTVLVTQAYHCGRCSYLARCYGFELHVFPLENKNLCFFGRNLMRERWARVFAFFEGLYYRSSKDGQKLSLIYGNS